MGATAAIGPLSLIIGKGTIQFYFKVVHIFNALITIPTDGIVFIVISSGTIQTGIWFHYYFLFWGLITF